MGFGLLFGGAFGAVVDFHDPPRRSAAQDTFFSGYALEMLVTRALAPRTAVKAGLTFDGNFETTNIQPVALAAIRF